MSSLSSEKFYSDISQMSSIRAITESLLCSDKVSHPSVSELYQISSALPSVTVTDLEIDSETAGQYSLPPQARVLNDNNGRIVGRTASARRFFNRVDSAQKKILQDIALEAVHDLCREHRVMTTSAVAGLNSELMFRCHLIFPESYSINAYNWLLNFTPYEVVAEKYHQSVQHNIADIHILAYPEWKSDLPEFSSGCVIVDEIHNTIIILGLRYFGEVKKGTLTLVWTAGMKLGMAACHGGIKQVDFEKCVESDYHSFKQRSISFFGLSGSGKSSHTNSPNNSGSLPEGAEVTVAHDDAFQIDPVKRSCYVWEPSLFDKTDGRGFDHSDWRHVISTQNNLVLKHPRTGKLVPIGLDIRNKNGRGIFSRKIFKRFVNKIGFPDFINWLMKDSTLPPIVRFSDPWLAVAMGATLLTKRTAAENVSMSEMTNLVFEPFANPFRVYELYRDCEAFYNLFNQGAIAHTFNSGGFWKTSDNDLEVIPLAVSHRLQTALLLDELSWQDWDILPGSQVPTAESVKAIIRDYMERYDPLERIQNSEYLSVFKQRFETRKKFIQENVEKPDLRDRLTSVLTIKL